MECDEESKLLASSTVGPLGLYECEQMLYGLTEVPTTFQRLMEVSLGDIHQNWCFIYVYDIIIFSETPIGHIKRLRGVFDKVATAGLKLKPSKCELFKTQITYVGHIVYNEGKVCS